MSNTFNYETNVTRLKDSYNKFSVSRIISNPLDSLLETELPASFPETFIVEITLYSLANNNVVFNTKVDNQTDPTLFTVTTLQYPDGTSRRLVFIDFSKLPLSIEVPDGRFEVVLNFYVPEIGNATTSSLILNKISPSRTEVEVKLAPQYRTPQSASLLTTFASPQINSTWVLDALKYICNQTQSVNPNIPTIKAALTFDVIQGYLPVSESNKINSSSNGQYTESIKRETQEILNKTYLFASQSIQTMVSPPQGRFTDVMLINIVSSSLQRALVAQGSTSLGSNFIII